MEWQTLLIIVNRLLWRVQILSPRSGPVHPSLGWWNCPTSEAWSQTFKVQPVSQHCWGVGSLPHPWEESKPKVVLARKAEVAPPKGSFHRSSHNLIIQGRIPHFSMGCEFPQALVPWLFLPDIPPPGSHSGTNLSQMTDTWLHFCWTHSGVDIGSVCLFRFYSAHAKMGNDWSGIKPASAKLIHPKCFITFEPADRIYTGWVPNVPWPWHFWVHLLCLRGEFTILLKICRPERVGPGEFGARSTEDDSWIGGKELV